MLFFSCNSKDMRGFVTAAMLLFLFVLAFAKTTAPEGVGRETSGVVCSVLHTDDALQHSIKAGSIIPLDIDNRATDMEYGNAHTLAHQVSASAGRMLRFSSVETAQFIKKLLRMMAIREGSLANSHARVYDSSHCLNWDNACEHYIFGMRRILI